MPGAKRILNGGDGNHLESRRGTRQQAVDYCRKSGEFTEWGRLEIHTQKELLELPIKDIKEIDPLFYMRYNRGIEKYKCKKIEDFRILEVIWLWGEPGSGKTRQVMEQDNVYKLDPPYQWWDGYEENDIILIDDYEDDTLTR